MWAPVWCVRACAARFRRRHSASVGPRGGQQEGPDRRKSDVPISVVRAVLRPAWAGHSRRTQKKIPRGKRSALRIEGRLVSAGKWEGRRAWPVELKDALWPEDSATQLARTTGRRRYRNQVPIPNAPQQPAVVPALSPAPRLHLPCHSERQQHPAAMSTEEISPQGFFQPLPSNPAAHRASAALSVIEQRWHAPVPPSR